MRWAAEFQQIYVNSGRSVDEATDIENVQIFDYYADGLTPHEAVKKYIKI